MKRIFALILALVMVLGLVACGGDKPTTSTPSSTPSTTPSDTTKPSTSTPGTTTTPEQPAEDPDAWKYGGTFVTGSSNATNTVDPHNHAGTLGNTRWMQHVWERPTVVGADGIRYPQVCDFEISEDGLTYVLKLRERYFSNGEKITMDDVWASLYRYSAGFTASSWDKYWKGCDIKRDGDTLTFTFEKYNINFAGTLSSVYWQIIPKEICDQYPPIEGKGELQPNGLIRGGEIPKIPTDVLVVGSGPYTLESWGDTEVVMKRNENYQMDEFEGATGMAAPRKAYFDEIVYAVNLNEESRTAAAIAGEYHLSWISNTSMMQTAEAVGMKKYDQGTTWTHGIFFNLDESNTDSPIANVNVRKAIRAVIDCNAALLVVTGGDQSAVKLVPTPIVEENKTYHNTIVADNEWNIKNEALAKEYLQKAGYNGEPIVYLTPSTGNPYKIAMALIPQMEKIGLKVELMAVDSGSHSAMRKDPNTGHDIGVWTVQKNDENPVLHSTFVTGSQGWWNTDAKNAALSVMKSSVTNSKESVDAYKQYCQAVVDEVPYILFGHVLNFNFVSADVVYDVQGNNEYYWNSYFKQK